MVFFAFLFSYQSYRVYTSDTHITPRVPFTPFTHIIYIIIIYVLLYTRTRTSATNMHIITHLSSNVFECAYEYKSDRSAPRSRHADRPTADVLFANTPKIPNGYNNIIIIIIVQTGTPPPPPRSIVVIIAPARQTDRQTDRECERDWVREWRRKSERPTDETEIIIIRHRYNIYVVGFHFYPKNLFNFNIVWKRVPTMNKTAVCGMRIFAVPLPGIRKFSETCMYLQAADATAPPPDQHQMRRNNN